MEKTNEHIRQDPVFTRGVPDFQETVGNDDEEEPLGMPEDMEGAYKVAGAVQPMGAAPVWGACLERRSRTQRGLRVRESKHAT